MTASKAQKLLANAAVEPDRLTRHLLVGAALREALSNEPVVVGGTAEDHYTADEYHATDLDLCGWLTPADQQTLRDLGFKKDGRHWVHGASNVPVEFPESRIDGDEDRIQRMRIRSGVVAIIGPEDLYLARVRQGTVGSPDRTKTREFYSALAIASATFDLMDWAYIRRRIAVEQRESRIRGDRMNEIDKAVRKALRRALRPGAGPPAAL